MQLCSQGQTGSKKQDVVHRQPLIRGSHRVLSFFKERPSASVINLTACATQFLCEKTSEGMHLWCLLDTLGRCGVRVDITLNPAHWSGQSLHPGNDPVSIGVFPFYNSSSVPLPTRLCQGNGCSLICMPKNCIYILNLSVSEGQALITVKYSTSVFPLCVEQ